MACGCGGGSMPRHPPPGWEIKPRWGFPGEKGMKEMVPNQTFNHLGRTKIIYRFQVGQRQFVDRRDLSTLPRERFE